MQKQSNFLAVYPPLLARIKGVRGVKAVKELGEFAEVLGGKAAPLDGAVYVVFIGNQPTSRAGGGRFQTEKLTFTLIYCTTYLSGNASKIMQAGEVLTALSAALDGWLPEAQYADSPLVREPSPAIKYHKGFVFYPMSFSTTASIAVQS